VVADHHEWACFQSQHAAEKAVISLPPRPHVDHHPTACGGVVREREKVVPTSAEHAPVRDQFYIPTRYPNGLDE
jgi:HEPN domain-containing protein